MQIQITMNAKNRKALNIALWIAQALLAVTLIWAAYTKLFTPADELAAMWPWTAGNTTLVKVTAFFDLVGGIGIILQAIRKMNGWTIAASYGIIALMITASVFHISRGEADLIGINIFLLAIAVFVVWGRRRIRTGQ